MGDRIENEKLLYTCGENMYGRYRCCILHTICLHHLECFGEFYANLTHIFWSYKLFKLYCIGVNSKWLQLSNCVLSPALQLWGRRHISGWAEGAVEHEEAFGGNFLKWLQQIPGGHEGAGLRSVADEQQEERVSVGCILKMIIRIYCKKLRLVWPYFLNNKTLVKLKLRMLQSTFRGLNSSGGRNTQM